MTGPNVLAALLAIKVLDGLVPVDFKTNTALAEGTILRIENGH